MKKRGLQSDDVKTQTSAGLTSVFRFQSYKEYMIARLGDASRRQGLKSKAALRMGCQPTYVSQVLHGPAHLSLEQAQAFNEFIGHSKLESNFFLLMVQHERAGTPALKKHFLELLQVEAEKTLSLTKRLGKQNSITPNQQARYYSSWHYAAIHMALTIPKLRDSMKLSEYFKISIRRVNLVLGHLEEMGLIFREAQDRFVPSVAQIRIGRDSTMIVAHHQNLRQVAIRSLDHETVEDLHYSAILTLSAEDARKLKDRMLEEVGEVLKVVRASKEEEVFAYNIDFFSMRLD